MHKKSGLLPAGFAYFQAGSLQGEHSKPAAAISAATCVPAEQQENALFEKKRKGYHMPSFL
ncbi:MAG: hypothetical protein ACT6RN_27495 [Agrobacterium sp.]|uniref:hypothetical protein n=1 Tax=Agrobacterium sp. TaxID=361 RepID=UPI00403842E9